ncbi:MAG: bifunctional diaminohydroxyphosphoribosylaminopyrimidine deaminase/5-amino-6-(5-phosphoribosylamino)uracil reductase RibD [Nitrospirota bacterium]|jgi:diaminohydroxyphosphoribosylaminopyrimidine deaminase/5-amino-6-(5-phosphoribosylamino)uracil reductase
MASKRDRHYMRRALTLARRGLGYTSPNPAVGAVLVKGGRIVGEGYHRRAGTPHAEIHALEAAGARARGATLYVTLEPCAHHGRTGPCCVAVAAAGVRRVVVASADPNPQVAGEGIIYLRRRRIAVETGVERQAADELNEDFFVYITQGRPFVTWKGAMSLDGRIATRSGASQWITGEAARRAGHRLRRRADAILVGRTTVAADDPTLTDRAPGRPHHLLRVVVASRLRLPLDRKVFEDQQASPTVVYTTAAAPAKRRRDLESAGVEVVVAGDGGRVDPVMLMADLARREVMHLLIEGGGEVAASFLEAGLVDRVTLFVAPLLIGGRKAFPVLGGLGITDLIHAPRLVNLHTRRLGEDLMLTGRLRVGEHA